MAKNSFAKASKQDDPDGNGTDDGKADAALLEALKKCRKNDKLSLVGFDIKEVRHHRLSGIIPVLSFLQWKMQDSL